MVPMRDGVRLAADVYLPAGADAGPGPWPALLERTPYDKTAHASVQTGHYFAARGYAVVIQDVRGRYASEGEWYPFADEAPDGEDTLAWVVRQPWCDGKVGTIGLSYSACTQTALGACAPPGLAAQFISEGHHNYHTGSMRQGGALEQRFMIYAFRMAKTAPQVVADPVKRAALEQAHRDIRQWLGRAPIKPGLSPLRFLPSVERWLIDIWRHGEYDDYWRSRPAYSIEERYDDYADVPIYLLGGWYDSYAGSTTRNYVEFSRRKKSPIRLIMGPWVHGVAPIGQTYAGDVDFGPDAAVDYNWLRLRWFDQVLKGVETGILDEPPVRIFVMGGGSGRKLPDGRLDHGGRWRFESEWPLSRAVPTRFYLQPDGGLATSPPAEGAGPACSRYRYDPRDPVPTIGGNISAVPEVMPGGGFDQRGRPDVYGAKDTLPLSARHDVLVFSTPPLERPVEVTGPMTVELWVESTAPDTDFTAKLIDVYPPNEDYPDGYELNITDSIVRLRYRNSREAPELLRPGEVVRCQIQLYPTSNLFAAGHQIRLHISSSNYPRFDVNPNTGEPLGTSGRTEVATNSVYHSSRYPSHITLPIVS